MVLRAKLVLGLLLAASLLTINQQAHALRPEATGGEEVSLLGVAAPALPEAPEIPTRSVSVADYGAVPNDGVDDTRNIQDSIDAINAKGGGSVLFPGGKYDISIQPTSAGRPHPQALALYSKLRLAGANNGSATLHLASNQGAYESILGTADYGTDLDDFALEDLTIDANGQKNLVTRAEGSDPCCVNSPDFGTDAELTPRIMLRVYAGNRVKIDNAAFLNNTGLWAIAINGGGETVKDADITNSKFTVGSDAADFDHSTIYSDSVRARVANNTFDSWYGAGTKGARTAMEIHALDQTVTGNRVSGYTYGVNVVGASKVGGFRQLYENNTFTDVSAGFVLWSLRGKRSVADETLADVQIIDNSIKLNLADWFTAKLTYSIEAGAGIMLQEANDAPVDRLLIAGNKVDFTSSAQGKASYFQRKTGGIVLSLYTNPDLPIRGLRVEDNTISGSLGPAIYSTVPIVGDTQSVIRGNIMIDPARGAELRYDEATDQRSAIFVSGTAQRVQIVDNKTQVKTETDVPLAFGVNALATCLEDCRATGNTVEGSRAEPVRVAGGWSRQ